MRDGVMVARRDLDLVHKHALSSQKSEHEILGNVLGVLGNRSGRIPSLFCVVAATMTIPTCITLTTSLQAALIVCAYCTPARLILSSPGCSQYGSRSRYVESEGLAAGQTVLHHGFQTFGI